MARYEDMVTIQWSVRTKYEVQGSAGAPSCLPYWYSFSHLERNASLLEGIGLLVKVVCLVHKQLNTLTTLQHALYRWNRGRIWVRLRSGKKSLGPSRSSSRTMVAHATPHNRYNTRQVSMQEGKRRYSPMLCTMTSLTCSISPCTCLILSTFGLVE